MGQLFTIPVLGTTPSVSALTENGLLVSRRTGILAQDNNRQFIASQTEECLAGIYNDGGQYWVGITNSSVAQDVYMNNIRDDEVGVFATSHVEANTASRCYSIKNNEPDVEYTFYYEPFESYDALLRALGLVDLYPITYHYTNSTVSGPSEAAVGDTVAVSAVPDVDYGITDASTQIIVTNNDVAVPYTWDAVNQRITFTMPDPT